MKKTYNSYENGEYVFMVLSEYSIIFLEIIGY